MAKGEKRKKVCHAIYAFLVRLKFSRFFVHVSLKMELEIKFSKSRSKFSLNNDNFWVEIARGLVLHLLYFFWDKNRC